MFAEMLDAIPPLRRRGQGRPRCQPDKAEADKSYDTGRIGMPAAGAGSNRKSRRTGLNRRLISGGTAGSSRALSPD